MDFFNVKQSSRLPQDHSKNLVFIPTVGLVACEYCKTSIYPKFDSKLYKGLSGCQLTETSSRKTKSKLKKAINCPACLKKENKPNFLLKLFKNQNLFCETHQNLFKPSNLTKQAIFNGIITGKSDIRLFKNNLVQEEKLNEGGLYFERLLKTLYYSGKPCSDSSTYNFINSFVSSYIPDNSIKFLTLIDRSKRQSFIEARRRELVQVTGIPEKELDSWLGKIILSWFGKRSVTGVVFLLCGEEICKTATSIFASILKKVYDVEEISIESLYREAIEAFTIKISDLIALKGAKAIDKAIRREMEHKMIQLIGFESQFFDLLIFLAQHQIYVAQTNNAALVQRNSSLTELIENMQARTTNYLFDEISEEIYLKEVLEKVKQMKYALNSSYSIEEPLIWNRVRQSSVNMSVSDRLSLLFYSNTVKTALNLLSILDGIDSDGLIIKELTSLLADISFGCFEISLFIFISLNTTPKTSVYLHKLHSICFEILIGLSESNPKLKNTLIDLNLPIQQHFDISYLKDQIYKVLKMKIYSPESTKSDKEVRISITKRESSSVIEMDKNQKSTVTQFLSEALQCSQKRFIGEKEPITEVISKYTEIHLKTGLRYSNYIFSLSAFTLNQFFAQIYLKKQINDSEIDSPIFFHKDLLLETLRKNVLDSPSKFKICSIYLNQVGSIGCSRFSRAILSKVFDLDLNFKTQDGKLPLRVKFDSKKGKPELGIISRDNLKFENEYIFNEFVNLTQFALEQANSLKEALLIFRDFYTVITKFQGELYFSGALEKIKNIHSTITKLILVCPVAFESQKSSFSFENISRFKLEEDRIVFEKEVESCPEEVLADFETRVILNSSNKTKLSSIEPKKAVSEMFYDLDIVSFKKAILNLKKVLASVKIEYIPDLLDVLKQIMSQSEELFFEEIKDFLPNLMAIFFYVMLEFTSSFNKASLEGISSVFYAIITKNIEILKTLVNYNRMKVRRELSEMQIPIDFSLSLNEKLEILGKDMTFDIFSLMNTFLDGIIGEIIKICNSATEKSSEILEEDSVLVSIVLKIVDLMRELLEGNSAENIKKMCENKANLIEQLNKIKHRKDILKLTKTLDNFYFSLYLEINVGEEERSLIEKILPCNQVQQKMISSFQMALDQSLCEVELTDKNAAKKIIYEFYYDKYKFLFNNEEFKFAVSCFVFLKNKPREELAGELKTVFEVLATVTKNVEISVDGEYKMIYYIDNPENRVIKASSKLNFIKYMDRSNSAIKKQNIVDHSKYISQQIQFIFKHGFDKGYKRMFNKLRFNSYLIFMILICLYSISLISLETSNFKLDSDPLWLLRLGCALQVLLSTLLVGLYLITRVRLEFDKAKYFYLRHNNKIFVSFFDRLKISVLMVYRQKYLYYPLVVSGTAAISIMNDRLYWVVSLQMLLVIYFSENLKNVVRAVHTRSKQLILVTVFMSILLLIFALLTFVHLNKEFVEEDYKLCQTPMHCFTSQFDFGLRMGGGMGDFMPTIAWKEDSFWKRFIFAQAHYAIFPIVMLNIVAGIIIDTFADLREKTQRLQNDMNNVCVICSREKSDIERKDTTFHQHVTETHRPFNYIFFIIYIETLKEDECDYYQTLVRQKLEEGDLSWFPDESDEDNKILKKFTNTILTGIEEQFQDHKNAAYSVNKTFASKSKSLKDSVKLKFRSKMIECEKAEENLVEYLEESTKEMFLLN